MDRDASELGQIQRLQRCIGDLTSLLAMPAMWAGREPGFILETTIDALLGMLRLDLAYGCVPPTANHDVTELLRAAGRADVAARAAEIGKAMRDAMPGEGSSATTMANPLGGGALRLTRATLGGENGLVLLASSRPSFPSDVETLLIRVACSQATIGLQGARLLHDRTERLTQQAAELQRLQGLATASLAITSNLSLDDVLGMVTDQARELIGAHQAATSLSRGEGWAKALRAVSLSDQYTQGCGHAEGPDGSGLYSFVCRSNCTLRLTQAELEAHPASREFGEHTGDHPPMRGWLAAPLIAKDGRNIGIIQLSDKVQGDFTEQDEAILVQLASMASVAIENARLYTEAEGVVAREQEARREAEAANRLKDEFLATMSHELRTPLSAVLGWTQLLRLKRDDPAAMQKGLDSIERNARVQVKLVEDVLDVSRIVTGKLILNMRPVDVWRVVEAAVEVVRPTAGVKDVVIDIRGDTAAGMVSADPDRLQQIVWNLLTNSVKFTPRGGRVVVSLERRDDHAILQVIDTGQGIEPEFLPFLWERFRQADSSTTRIHGGLGLGLAIVRYLVEAHGGTAHAYSAGLGHGATFTIRLPLTTAALADRRSGEAQGSGGAPGAPSSELPDLTGLRVLVVDDEDDARDIVSTVLRERGAEVLAARSAAEAFEGIQELRPDVLISDLAMPQADGYGLLRRIRALPPERGGRTPAIALTAYARADDRKNALLSGFQMYLSKPVAMDELVLTVANAAGRIRP